MIRLHIPVTMPGFNQILELAKRQERIDKKKASKFKKANKKPRLYSPYNILKNALTRQISNIVKSQTKDIAPEPASINFLWVCEHKHLDPDNIAVAKKFILDGLVKAKIMTNDGWKQVAQLSDDFIISEKGKVIVTIRPYNRTHEEIYNLINDIR